MPAAFSCTVDNLAAALKRVWNVITHLQKPTVDLDEVKRISAHLWTLEERFGSDPAGLAYEASHLEASIKALLSSIHRDLGYNIPPSPGPTAEGVEKLKQGFQELEKQLQAYDNLLQLHNGQHATLQTPSDSNAQVTAQNFEIEGLTNGTPLSTYLRAVITGIEEQGPKWPGRSMAAHHERTGRRSKSVGYLAPRPRRPRPPRSLFFEIHTSYYNSTTKPLPPDQPPFPSPPSSHSYSCATTVPPRPIAAKRKIKESFTDEPVQSFIGIIGYEYDEDPLRIDPCSVGASVNAIGCWAEIPQDIHDEAISAAERPHKISRCCTIGCAPWSVVWQQRADRNTLEDYFMHEGFPTWSTFSIPSSNGENSANSFTLEDLEKEAIDKAFRKPGSQLRRSVLPTEQATVPEQGSAGVNEDATLGAGTQPGSLCISGPGDISLEGTTLGEMHNARTTSERGTPLAAAKRETDSLSMVSNEEDIASQATRQRTGQEILAVREFGSFFAGLEELRPLHEDAVAKLGTRRFLENYRRILKVFVLQLRKEAKTALEKDTVKVIENRENRRNIAQRVVALMEQEDEDDMKPLEELAFQPIMKRSLEDWARNTYGAPDDTFDALPDVVSTHAAPDPTLDAVSNVPQDSIPRRLRGIRSDVSPKVVRDIALGEAACSDRESEEEGGDGDNGNNESQRKDHLRALTFPTIEKACQFLRKNMPFRTLVLQLRLLSLPLSLREIVETSPKRSIKISAKDDASFTNSLKAIAEAYTATPWEWWPLAPRIPDVAPGRARLEWQFCGQPLYKEISSAEAESIRQVLDITDDYPPDCNCCKVPSCRVDWSTAFRLLSQAFTSKLPAKLANPSSTGVTPPSKAHLRYTPAPTTGTSSSLSVPQSTPSAPPNHSMSGNAGPQNQPGGNANNAPVDYFWIVFGIKDIDGFDEIENIETTTQLKDPSFFEDLKSRHKRHRWFFQDWFSPYRFRFCRFVQFEEVIQAHISCTREALPDDHGYTDDYEYHPRPPTVIPPIDEKTFSILLTACDSICYWSLLPRFLHKCRQICTHHAKQHWKRIPRKKGAFHISAGPLTPNPSATETVAFGIEADYLPSAAFFFVYHVILILPAFGFWVYWLKYHPNDLQNASVPLFTVLGLVAAFWALVGKRASHS